MYRGESQLVVVIRQKQERFLKTLDTWSEYFSGDSDLLCALDRIFDDTSVFIKKGDSFRGQKLETIKLEVGPALPGLTK